MKLVSSPRFNARADANRLVLTDHERSWLLNGSVYVDIARLLSQGTTAENLQAQLQPVYGVPALATAVLHLQEIGYLRQQPSRVFPASMLGWWEAAGGEPSGSVSIGPPDAIGVAELAHALSSSGVSVASDAPVRILLTEDDGSTATEATDVPVLLAHLTSPVVIIGPLLQPGTTPPCAACLRWWLSLHHVEERLLSSESVPAPRCFTSASLSLGVGALVSQVTQILLDQGRHARLERSRLLVDTCTLKRRWEAFRAAPDCPQCGGSARDVRSRALKTFVSRAGGMIRSLEVSSQRAVGLHHATAEFVYPLSGGGSWLRPNRAFGSHPVRRIAMDSCLAEAVERYSLAWTGQRETNPAPVNPEIFLLRSEHQHLAASATEADLFAVPQQVPHGVELACITAEEGMLVPAGIVYFGWDFPNEPMYAYPDTNGCAAGRSTEEALISAFHELIERDALSVWWDNRVLRPGIRIRDSRTRHLLEALEREGRTPWLLDITTDIGIPACAAVAPTGDGSCPVFASAANIRPQLAVFHALRELAGIVHGLNQAPATPLMADWLARANTSADEFAWLKPHGSVEWNHQSGLAESKIIRDRIHATGFTTDWIDMTRSETRVPVVRALAPGLRHPWRRYAPGRLYDVPVKLGWRTRALYETELNPDGCFL